MKRIFSIVYIFFILLLTQKILSQDNSDKSFYGGLLYISNYIASDHFLSLKENKTDLNLIDSIYIKALKYYDGDISETLLCLTFSTIPFNEIKVRVPIFHSQINIPLPSPPKKIFIDRTKNLPKNIFPDSPQTAFGDKDKLAHFFGNAFLGYNFGWFNLSKFMGMFVEQVEDGLFVNGEFDYRDLIANNMGEFFGKALNKNQKTMPSEVLNIYQLLYLRIIL